MALIFQNKYVFLFLPYKVLNRQENMVIMLELSFKLELISFQENNFCFQLQKDVKAPAFSQGPGWN